MEETNSTIRGVGIWTWKNGRSSLGNRIPFTCNQVKTHPLENLYSAACESF
jgi:hypothetical protein